jgi:excisionase family DNA binding protein
MTNLPFPHTAEYLSVKEVAGLFRVCTKTVRRWIASGDLPATRFGRDWRIARNDLKVLAAARGNQVQGSVL